MEKNIIEEDELAIEIGGKRLKLKVTLGFWKHCGFKREEAQIIDGDPEAMLKALKLAVYYGNKFDYNWKSPKDVEGNFPDDLFEDIEEDCSKKLTLAMIHYLPKKMRDASIQRIKMAEKAAEVAIENAGNEFDEEPPALDNGEDSDDEKKN